MTAGIWRDERHVYGVNYPDVQRDGIPSVTTILGVVAKPQLVVWQVTQAARFAAENVALVADMVEKGGVTDTAQWIATGPDRTRDRSGSVGTAVHALCERVAWGEVVSATELEKPYVDGFAAWLRERNPSIIATEGMGANLDIGYAGTFDLIAEIDGARWLLDLKTGKSVYPETAGQLAAYAKFEFLGKEDDATKYPMPQCSRFAVLHLQPGRTRFVEYRPTSATWDMFKGAVAIHRWLKGEALSVMLGGKSS